MQIAVREARHEVRGVAVGKAVVERRHVRVRQRPQQTDLPAVAPRLGRETGDSFLNLGGASLGQFPII